MRRPPYADSAAAEGALDSESVTRTGLPATQAGSATPHMAIFKPRFGADSESESESESLVQCNFQVEFYLYT